MKLKLCNFGILLVRKKNVENVNSCRHEHQALNWRYEHFEMVCYDSGQSGQALESQMTGIQ